MNSLRTLAIFLAIISCTFSQYHQQQPLGTNYDTLHSSRQETIGSNGDVLGQYSYLDPTGSKVVVKYSAGKDGYRVLNDNVIPSPAPQHQDYQYNYYQPQEHIPQQYAQSPAQPQIQSYHQNAPNNQYYHEYRSQPQVQPQPQYQEYAQQYQHQELTEAPAYQQEQAYQNEQSYQPKFTQAVFTPAANPYPAESEEQIKAYYEALEEEKKEAAKQGYEGKSTGAKAHVSVQSPNIGYSYNLNL